MWWSPPSYTAWRSHSNTPSESFRIGAPASPQAQGVVPNRSSSRVAKRIEAGCCPVWRTLTANWVASISAAALAAGLARHTSSSGGSSDTEVKLLTVKPAGDPSGVRQVTTVTPVAKQPSAARKVRGSCPLRYSWCVGWAAISGLYREQVLRRQSQHLGDRCLQRFRDQVARLEGIMLVWRVHRALHREGQSLDRIALQAEMRFPEARGEARAENLELAAFLRQPELDAVPIEPRRAMTLAGGNRGAAQPPDM